MEEASESKKSSTTFIHPEEQVIFDPLLTWLNPLIRLAAERQLKEEDVWESPHGESVDVQAKKFWTAWYAEIDRVEGHSLKNTRPSFIRAIFAAYGDRFIKAGIFQFLFMILQLGQPFLVGELVAFISSPSGSLNYGIGLALGFAAISLCSSLSLAYTWTELRRLGVVVRSVIMMAVYEQALQLTTAARMQSTVGQTTNLIAIDAEKLNLAVQFVHFIWHGPIAALAIVIILIFEIGYAPALVGLGCIICLLPLQNYLAEQIGIIRRSMVRQTDERVKLTNELLQAIRVIKLYAWEKAIETRVESVRYIETTTLRKYLDAAARLRELLFAAQPVLAIIMFSTAAFAMHKPLTVVQVFKMIAFLNTTRFPLNLLAQALKNVKDGMVSISRLNDFFLLPTLAESQNQREAAERASVTLLNASFAWVTSIAPPVPMSKSQASKSESQQSSASSSATATDNKPQPTPQQSSDYFTLQSLSFTTSSPNELIAVIGSVGSGKSSLIQSILGEMVLLAGQRNVMGTIAYCAQTPWIQNLSLKQNIFFGLDASNATVSVKNNEKYHQAMEAAALLPDLAILPAGDMTEIGEKGINLSGGQKSRVSLARAFFSSYRSQVYLLDDPFSAVDGNTGNHIFKQGILSVLHDKLRIIALNSHMHLLRYFDRIVVMEKGMIIADGSFVELCQSRAMMMAQLTGMTTEQLEMSVNSVVHAMNERQQLINSSASSSLPTTVVTSVEKEEESKAADNDNDNDTTAAAAAAEVAVNENDRNIKIQQAAAATATATSTAADNSEEHQAVELITIISNKQTTELQCQTTDKTDSKNKKDKPLLGTITMKRLIHDEKLESAFDTFTVYLKYYSSALSSATKVTQQRFYSMSTGNEDSKEQEEKKTFDELFKGLMVLFGLLTLFSMAQVFRVGVDYLLAVYAQHYDSSTKTNMYYKNFYYSCFGCLIASLMIRSVYVNYFAVRSSRYLHAAMLRTVLSAPIPIFFDTHTVGAILNRFAKDIETVDVNIPEFMLQLLINWTQVLSIFGLCLWAAYWFAIILVPLLYGFTRVYHYFSSASKSLKRLESVSRSPIYSGLSETLTGLETIRAYGDTPRFLSTHLTRMNRNQKVFFHLWMIISWMTVRLELATSLILLAVALLAVCLRNTNTVSPISLGLALSYGLQLTALFQRVVQISIEMTTYMTSTERVLQYLEDIPSERDVAVPDEEYEALITASHSLNKRRNSKQPEPQQEKQHGNGGLILDNVWMSYRDNPPVLRGLSLTIQAGERIGICGRTGAGKSSVMMALFRVIELSQGKIILNGKNIAQTPLTTLRSSLAIIPQDAVLFTGSLRFQLDPFNQYSDEKVWMVLTQVGLLETVQMMPKKLLEPIAEGGENLSQGQRQLLCIARALLRDVSVLVVDEGTSAVDPFTDNLIQQVLRQQAQEKGVTILAIAHRLQTIVDFDRILVLGQGQVLEFDTPKNLLMKERDPPSVFATMIKEAEMS